MKLFVVAMLSFVVSSCAANSFKQLKGIWTSCDEEGYYFELHITDDAFRYLSWNGLSSENHPYTITGDSLIYKNPYLRFKKVSAHLQVIAADTIDIFYPSRSVKHTFVRVGKLSEGQKPDQNQLKKAVLERTNNSNCEVITPVAENPFIYFEC